MAPKYFSIISIPILTAFLTVNSLVPCSIASDPVEAGMVGKDEKENDGKSCDPSSVSSSSPSKLSYDPESFSKLKLNVEELYGSRWAIDQRREISISHAIDITDASLIHANQLTLRVEFNLRQSWAAPGLEFPQGLFKETDPPNTFVSSSDQVLHYMWSPDSYISTSRESNMNTVGTPLSLVYIFKNRTIIFKVRMFTKVGCSSSFQWYPLDVQHCDLVIESYKYQDDIVSYYWTDPTMYRPVVIQIGRLFQYELQYPLYYDNGTFIRGGRGKRYPFVRLRFTFERKLGNNLIQVYTPTMLVVVLSWFSFWLGLDAIPGRISLLVTCMLTLVTMHGGIKSTIPPVHYITMMDLWMVVCMAMVFCAVCEFIMVKYLHWRHHNQHQHQQKQKTNLLPMTIQDNNIAEAGTNLSQIILSSNSAAAHSPSKINLASLEILKSIFVKSDDIITVKPEDKENTTATGDSPSLSSSSSSVVVAWWVLLDKFCRVIFPSLFCLFNAIYWPLLLHGSQVQNQQNKPSNTN